MGYSIIVNMVFVSCDMYVLVKSENNKNIQATGSIQWEHRSYEHHSGIDYNSLLYPFDYGGLRIRKNLTVRW